MNFATYDLLRAANGPVTASGGHRIFVADTTPDSITLAAGVYEVANEGAVAAYLRIGAAVSIPADKAAEVSAQTIVFANGATTIALAEEAAVHALTGSSSATLHFVRKAAL